MMTHKQWRTTIALLVVFVLSVFCVAPFGMHHGHRISGLIYACDRDGMILLCPILAVALLTSVAAYCSMRYEDPSESTGHRMGRRP
jgi:hypothetical protein